MSMGAKLGENSLCGAEEAWGAHNPQVVGSKPTKAIYLFVLLPSLASLNQSVRCHNHATPWLLTLLFCVELFVRGYIGLFSLLCCPTCVPLPTQPPTCVPTNATSNKPVRCNHHATPSFRLFCRAFRLPRSFKTGDHSSDSFSSSSSSF